MPTTLPARYYTDPAIFQSELERFYFTRWIHAGRTDRLNQAGDYFLCELSTESVIVTRSANGALQAFYNVCRHRGTRMCTTPQGAFEGRIRCPYHAWTYALDGSLISAPNLDQPGFNRADYPLHKVAIDTWDGHIFLNFSPNPAPLLTQLSALPDKLRAWQMGDLRQHTRITYQVQANWKLIVQNYNECLHCPILHPMLNRLTDYLGADNEPPTPNYIGGSMGFRAPAETMSVDGVRRRAYLPGLNQQQRQQVAYYAIYPNLLLSLHPDYMMTHTLWPKAVDHTQIVCEWHFHPDEIAEPSFAPADAIDFWDQTNREDWAISEQSQQGIGSRAYTPGPYSKREELLHAFDQIIVAAHQPE